MKREEFAWASVPLDRDVPLIRYGHYGRPVVWFPTSAGDHFEAEHHGLIAALAPLIETGRIKLYCVGSITQDAWYDPDPLPAVRGAIQASFDRYIGDEVLPFVRHDCNNTPQKFLVGGASFGAYNAVNTAAKRPTWFDGVVALSGVFDLAPWYRSEEASSDYYFNAPVLYLPNLVEGEQLDSLRKLRFYLRTGRGRYEMPHESIHLAAILSERSVPHDLIVEGPDAHHDWSEWCEWLPEMLARLA